jgi:hypothetical protein
MDTILEIATTALCIWAVGHMWIGSFFTRKEELINKTGDLFTKLGEKE